LAELGRDVRAREGKTLRVHVVAKLIVERKQVRRRVMIVVVMLQGRASSLNVFGR
jgi:hypothetical protein